MNVRRRGLARTMASPGSMAARVACSCLQITNASLAFTPAKVQCIRHTHNDTWCFNPYHAGPLFKLWSGTAVVMAMPAARLRALVAFNLTMHVLEKCISGWQEGALQDSSGSGRSPGISSALVTSARQRSACSIACASVAVTALHTGMLEVSAASAGPALPCEHGLSALPLLSASMPAWAYKQCILITACYPE